MAVQLSHDGFARQTFMREKHSIGECQYCGARGRRFKYYTRNDDNMRPINHGVYQSWPSFCSVGCFRAWNNS